MKHTQSFKSGITKAFIGIIVFQSLLVMTFFIATGSINVLIDDATNIFVEKTNNKADQLNELMIEEWADIENYASTLTEEFENSDDLSGLTQPIYNVLMEMLRTSNTTGAYFVFADETPTANADVALHNGIYIRDTDPHAYKRLKSDLNLMVGAPHVSGEDKLTLDNEWYTMFSFDQSNKENPHFFYTPYLAAQKSQKDNSDDPFSYWSDDFQLNGSNYSKSISYSLPVMNDSGDIYGILGVEISKEYLLDSVLSSNSASNKDTKFVMLTQNERNDQYTIVQHSGGDSYVYLGNSEELYIAPENNSPLREIETTLNENVLISLKELQLYGTNQLFSDEHWYIARMDYEDEIFYCYQKLIYSMLVSGILVLLFGIMISILLGRRVTAPMNNLMLKLRTSDVNKHIQLGETGMLEVDELSHAIENLSYEVFINQQRISKIIALTEVTVGYYEHKKNSDEVYVTESLIEMLGWDDCEINQQYLPFDIFKEKIDCLINSISKDTPDIINIENKKWLKIAFSDENEREIGTISDITREIIEKKRVQYTRDYDVMTGTLSRYAFNERITALFKKGPSQLKVAALFMSDLDSLKYTNDKYGHEIGDIYIKEYAKLLKWFNYKNAIVSRRSGDEFYVFLYGYDTKSEIMGIIREFWENLSGTVLTISDEVKIKIRASGGVTWYPDDSKNYNDLMDYADFAMYTAKNNEKGTIQTFNLERYKNNAIVYKGQEELNDLIENNLIQYAIQPIVSAKDGSIFGFEMLMRPKTPFFKNVVDVLRTARFQNKLKYIEKLTWFSALQKAADALGNDTKFANAKIFINSIPNQILDDEDFEVIERKYKSILGRVVLELTEDYKTEADFTRRKLDYIAKWNCLLAIDDFGSGYNNENMIIDNNPDLIKIDMSLISNIDKYENKQLLVQNIINFSKKRGMIILAEGVESLEEIEMLIEMGIDLFQGYYFGKPDFEAQDIAPDKIAKILEINKRLVNHE